VAHSLSNLFSRACIPIASAERGGGRDGDTIGFAKFKDAESFPIGERDGLINHLWAAEFQVFNNL
jgi:hypothetical protein